MREELRINGTFLKADGLHGVHAMDSSNIHGTDLEMMNPQDFFDSLETLDDTETIYTFIDGNNEDIYDRIHDRYGIKG